VLRRDPAFARLAGFLGARHLSRAQLVRASGVDSHTCLQFIATMRSLSLLDVRLDPRLEGRMDRNDSKPDAALEPPGLTPAPARPDADRPAAPRAMAANAAPLGAFIHRLRRRFGLS
jgi:hypothetical protein